MAVTKVGETFKCNVCGNEVIVMKVGGGTLVCCGQEMELAAGEVAEEIEEELKDDKEIEI